MLRRTWRRYRWWWLLIVAAAVSAIAGLIAQSLPVLAGVLVVGVIGGLTGLVTVRAQHAIDRGDAAPRIVRQLRRVHDLRNPVLVGIHPALPPTTGEQVVPPFVARDQSAALAELLGTSRFVLVVGESTAGKSRMAYEAMRSRLPDHVFVHPQGKHDLADALQLAGEHRQAVLWLDDLESYLGIGGLTPDALSPLLSAPGSHTVVLATMRAHQRASYSPGHVTGIPNDEGSALVLAGKVLALAHEVRVERQWSRAELDRASGIGDGRIGRALERADEFGVAQYLAAAPELFKLWQDNRGSAPEGHPRGVALVAAAVDARRAGYHRGIPLDALRRLHDFYLGENKAHIRLETWDKAVHWATRPLYSTSSLLMPDGEDMYIAFDYLADAIDGVAPARELPLEVWDELVSVVPPEDIMEVAWSAFYRNRPLIAETALQKAFGAGHYEAALDFAYMMAEGTERAADVVAWLDRAINRADGTNIPPEQVLELRNQMAWWVGARWSGSGDPARARQLARDLVDDSTRILGEEHPQTLTSRLTLARQVGELGDHDSALAIATDVADILAGADDDLGIRFRARFEVAVWTRAGGHPRAAVALWQDLVAESVRAQDLGIIEPILNIAATAEELGDPELDYQVLGWLEELFAGQSGREVRIVLYVELGWILAWWAGGRDEGEGDHAWARDIAQHVIDTGTEALGPHDPHVLTTRVVLAHQLGKLGDGERALAISREITETSARIYGKDHRVTIAAAEEARRWGPAPDPGVAGLAV